MKQFYLILFLLLFSIITIYAKNDNLYTIYMIRHGEKPKNNGIGLSDKGNERAKCISNIFNKYNIRNIYVQKYKKSGKRERPYLTGELLAKKINLKIDTSCDRDDITCITNKVVKSSKNGNILIIWEHDNLEKIAKKLLEKFKINNKSYDSELATSNNGYDFLWKIYDEKLNITTEGCNKE